MFLRQRQAEHRQLRRRISHSRHMLTENKSQESRERHEHDSYTQRIQFLISLLFVKRQLVVAVEDQAIRSRCAHESSCSAERLQSTSFLLK
jgi:hypothetical protein